jgi:hypothetical protein
MTIPSHDEGGVLLSAVSVGIHGTTSKSAMLCMGRGWTRLPQSGAVEQPMVAVQ